MVNTNDRIALAVGATAGIAVIALLAVLRSDSFVRRRRDSGDAGRSARYQFDRWDNEGGSIPEDSVASGPPERAGRHA